MYTCIYAYMYTCLHVHMFAYVFDHAALHADNTVMHVYIHVQTRLSTSKYTLPIRMRRVYSILSVRMQRVCANCPNYQWESTH